MSDEVLEHYIRQLIESHRTNKVTVAWQGGEPTLMGIGFFRRAVEFFRDHGFLIGISIDGPRELHDAHRVDKSGKPTLDRVMRGLRLLQKHGVEYNILTAVNRLNADHPLEVYRFLRDEAGAAWMQFIPAIERLNEEEVFLRREGKIVSDRSVLPEQLGNFLITIFDEWVRRDVGKVFVQTFEATVRNWLGLPSSGMCVFDAVCGHGLALEHNGDLYSCDHFVEPRHLLGNIVQNHMIELASLDRQQKFGRDKLETLPRCCRECEVRFACRGECPKNRFIKTPDGEPGMNYLCAGYKAFFHHVDRPMKIIAALLRRGYPAAQVMQVLTEENGEPARAFARAGRNDPCPCGSGRKFKKCHGLEKTGRLGKEPRDPARHSQSRPEADIMASTVPEKP
jgi:uncharacterized protein